MFSSTLQFFIFIGILAILGETCGSVNTAADTTATTETPKRKRREIFVSEADITHVELQTTLTNAGDFEISKIESNLGSVYSELLAGAHRQVVDGVDGGKVIKYMLMNRDCGEAQLFASAIKDITSFVTGGTVRCNDQITNF